MGRRSFFFFLGANALAFAMAVAAPACSTSSSAQTSSTSTGAGGHVDGGAGGAGGCSMAPLPSFQLVVRAATGALPKDTAVSVLWSAGLEPAFKLDDPTTWKTLAEANIACNLDPKKPPKDLQELDCEIWTSGATEINVSASGFVPYDMTLTPMTSDLCMHPPPIPVKVMLEHQGDAG